VGEVVSLPVATTPSRTVGTGARRQGRPPIVELAGPAGCGKSTLARSLLSMDPTVSMLRVPRRLDMAPLYARRAASLLPTYLRSYRGTPWFTTPEKRAIALLDGWRRRVDEWADTGGRAVVFNQGPIFRLAVLAKLGPPITQSPAFGELLDGWMRAWRERLDVVVWLTAPGDVLLERIRTRTKDHAVKNWPDTPALERIWRFRDALEATIAEIADPSIVRLSFDSSRLSPEELADEVLAALRGERLLGA
jgi:cytidylate kinase